MKRKVCAAGAVRHQSPPVTGTAGTVSGGGAITASPAKRGSSSATPAGLSSKLETVTPSSRMPLAVGKSVRTSSTPAWRNRSCRATKEEKLQLRVTWRKSANFTLTVTVRPKACAFSHQAQNIIRHGLHARLDFGWLGQI